MENSLLDKLMCINVNTLRLEQYNALKQHAIDVLKDIIKDLNNDDLKHIQDYSMLYSPSGDGGGYENHFIFFNWVDDETDESIDLYDFIEIMKKLRHEIIMKS